MLVSNNYDGMGPLKVHQTNEYSQYRSLKIWMTLVATKCTSISCMLQAVIVVSVTLDLQDTPYGLLSMMTRVTA